MFLKNLVCGGEWSPALEDTCFLTSQISEKHKVPQQVSKNGIVRPLDYYLQKKGSMAIVPKFFQSKSEPRYKLFEQYVIPSFLSEKNQGDLNKSLNPNNQKTILLTFLVVHGMGEYSSRYLSFMERITDIFLDYNQNNQDNTNVIPVFYTFDFRCHGRSGGIRWCFGPLHKFFLCFVVEFIEKNF